MSSESDYESEDNGRARPEGSHLRPAPPFVRMKEVRPGDRNLVDRVYPDAARDLVRRGNAAAPAVIAANALATLDEPEPPRLSALRRQPPPTPRAKSAGGLFARPLASTAAVALLLIVAAATAFAFFAPNRGPSAQSLQRAAGAAPGTQSAPPVASPGASSSSSPSSHSNKVSPSGSQVSGSANASSSARGQAALAGASALGLLGSGSSAAATPKPSAAVFASLAAATSSPRIIGLHPKQAAARLRRHGLSPQQLNHPRSRRPLWVVSQSPAPGKTVSQGGDVSFRVSTSRPQVCLPNVVGLRYQAAAWTLKQYSFFAYRGRHRSTKPRGQVISQSPNGGECLRAGDGVDVVVSSGPKGSNQAPPEHHPTPSGSASGNAAGASSGNGGNGGGNGNGASGQPTPALPPRSDVTGAVSSTTSSVSGAVSSTGSTAAKTTGTTSAVHSATSTVSGTISSAGKTSGGSGTTQGATSSAAGTVSSTSGTVDNTVSGATSAVPAPPAPTTTLPTTLP